MEITKLPLKVKERKRRKVAAYARVSTGKDDQLHSLAAQVSYYTKLINANPEWEFSGIYIDEGVSGTGIDKRRDFLRMMEDARSGRFDLLITKSVSRFARNTVDLLKSVRELQDLNVEVKFEKENISSFSYEGELILTLVAAFSQAESESISNNVKWSHRKKMETGQPSVPIRCFGYEWDEEKEQYIIVESEAYWVRYIYTQYLSGASIKGLSKDLKQKGINGLRGDPLGRTTIRRILTSEMYVGDLILQKYFCESPGKAKVNRGELPKYLVADAHEAIISREDFSKVQALMEQRYKESDNFGYVKGELAGLIRCGKCGKAVGSVSRRNGDDRLECNFYKLKKCGLRPIKKAEFIAVMNSCLAKKDRLKNAVIYDDSIDFYLEGGGKKTAARSIDVLEALRWKIECLECGDSFRRMKSGTKMVRICKTRASKKEDCSVRSINETALLELLQECLGTPDNLLIKIYSDVARILIGDEEVHVELKEGGILKCKRK